MNNKFVMFVTLLGYATGYNNHLKIEKFITYIVFKKKHIKTSKETTFEKHSLKCE